MLLGMSFPNEQDEALAAAMEFKAMSLPELEQTRRLAAIAVADKGRCWWNPETAT